MIKISLIVLSFFILCSLVPSVIFAQEEDTQIGSFKRICIGTCGCTFEIRECDVEGCGERKEGPNCKAAPSACNNECVGGSSNTFESTILKSILEWNKKIITSLERGSDNDFNRLPEEISTRNYFTGTYSGKGEANWYWCTYSIIDSYQLAGIDGLKKNDGFKEVNQGPVVNMRNFWKEENGKGTYIYIDYPEEVASSDRIQIVKSVKPGYALFMEKYPGEFKSKEHVALVIEVSIDDRGNGYIKTRDSNENKKEYMYAVDGGKIEGTYYPVRGFGGVEENAQPVKTLSVPLGNVFDNLPGKHSAAVILPNGKEYGVNGGSELPAFSTIKLWIVAAVMESIEQGNLSLTDTYTMNEGDKKYGGTGIITTGTTPNTLTVQQYMEYALIHSDNIATNVLINMAGGIDNVNTFINRTGYTHTKLQRYLGITSYTAENDNYTSAHDGALFMKNLFEGKIVSEEASKKIISILEKRSQEKQDPIFIGQKGYIGKSGIGPNTRNDIGSFEADNGERVYMGILLSNIDVTSKGEKAIRQAAASIAESVQ